MKKLLYNITISIMLSVVFCADASAEGFSGWGDIKYGTLKQTEYNQETTTDTFSQNYYLKLDKEITSMIFYNIYLRTTIYDSRVTDPGGDTTKTYRRSVEPAIDFFIKNPMYEINAGYRRQERWSTAGLGNKGRKTKDYYYSRLNINPVDLPYLTLQLDRQKDHDYLSPRETASTESSYSANSGYNFSGRSLKLGYTLGYIHSINETPADTTTKTVRDNLTGTYNAAYSRSFWNGKANISTVYQGSYARNKSRQFLSGTGSLLFERTPFGGLYAQGTAVQPDVNVLNSEGNLINKDYNTGISSINIGTQQYNNIGVWISSGNTVDRLYIYVDRDVSQDTSLTNAANWRVYTSNSNILGTIWTQISVQGVAVTVYDAFNNIYRYELIFSAPQTASYFKAVNMVNVNAAGLTDVLVTEIEAYGMDTVTQEGIKDVSTFFTQGLSVNADLRPLPELRISLNYHINRADQHPGSILNSMGGVFTNILSRTVGRNGENLISNLTRTYGITTTWMTHRLLTTTLSLQRNEAFDNKDVTEISSNTYSLSFNSSPLPTLDTNLSFIGSDSYSLGSKQSRNSSVLLSLGSRLYRDVNMITDIGYTESKSYSTGTVSDTGFVSGSLYAVLTRKLSGNLIYSFSRISSEDKSYDSTEGATIITYRPGRLINFSGSFRISNIGSDTNTSGGLLLDWLPLKTIRLNLNYQHSRSEPGPSVTDSLSSYGIWYITRFMDLRLTYNLTKNREVHETKTYNFGANLNCRF